MADPAIGPDGQLTEAAKTLIHAYLFKIGIPSAVALSILSALGGFAINEVARGTAYVQAYGEVSKNILETASKASQALGQAESLRDASKKSSDDAETALSAVRNAKLQLEKLISNDADAIATALVAKPDFKTSIANIQQDEFKKLGGQVSSLRDSILAMQSVSSNSIVRGTNTDVAANKGSVPPLNGTYSLDNDQIVSCPPGSFVSAIQAFKTGGDQSPVIQIRYACRSLK